MFGASCAIILFCMALAGCQTHDNALTPRNPAKVQIQLQFPNSITDANGNRKKSPVERPNIEAIDDVAISVLEAGTGEVLINQQQLEISFSTELNTSVAKGDLSIPVSRDFQQFEIIVFAADAGQLVFLLGSTNAILSPGEIKQVPIRVQLRAPNLIAPGGTATASSVFEDRFPASLALDFDFATSWFSRGSNSDGSTSTYTWNGPGSQFIAVCGIVNNTRNSDPAFRTGFGFGTVTFQVYSGPNATGDLAFEKTVPYPKTAEVPFVKVAPLVAGRSIKLLLQEHEAPNCGGFSELLIVGK